MIRRLIAVVVAGLALALTFPPFSWPMPAAVAAIAVFVWSLREARPRERAAIGLVFGLTFFAALLNWLRVVGLDAWLAVALICAVWWALAAALVRPESPMQVAFVFTAAELFRDRLPWGGFGWGQVGILLADAGPARTALTYIGQVGATWLLWWLAAGIASLWANQRSTAVLGLAAIAAVVYLPVSTAAAAELPKAQIALVQGGVDNTGLGNLGDARSVLRRHVQTTLEAKAKLAKTQLVVWPENAVDIDPFRDASSRAEILATQRKLDVPLLAGAVLRRTDGRAGNASLLVDGTGLNEIYAKQRLVPFGEFMPLRKLIESYTDRAALMPVDFAPGTQSGWVNVAGERVGLLICFEVADDNLAWDRDYPISGLVVQTNNATYDGLGQAEQQMLYAKVRAIENELPVFVASTDGASAVINSAGDFVAQILQGKTGVIVGGLAPRQTATVASRLHDAEVGGILFVAALLVTAGFVRRRRYGG